MPLYHLGHLDRIARIAIGVAPRPRDPGPQSLRDTSFETPGSSIVTP